MPIDLGSNVRYFRFSADNKSWALDRSRRLAGASSPDYVAVDEAGSALFVSSGKPFKFEYDSVNPVEEETISAQTTVGKNCVLNVIKPPKCVGSTLVVSTDPQNCRLLYLSDFTISPRSPKPGIHVVPDR